ncbi:hypothetical protein J7355_12325 [Endozoicomonas sp. G2_2]|uniref:hypothetical protein n=1 Tax=Endozoicomonas sp. G2_2 TaxID=2821092 RepID=UPI001ADA0834|nr:hypothetical protein [Endozoicomonas sp. G2_2]MBO9470889.1 hypothetical protein [Endozoicomonas sp. G2_2]
MTLRAPTTANPPQIRRVVGLIPAPELPERIVELVLPEMATLLGRYIDDRCDWQVDTVTEPVIGARDDTQQLVANAASIGERRGWDYVLCLTDLPIFRGAELTIAEASEARGVAFLSLPALGAAPLRRRVREALLHLLNELHHGSSDAARDRQQDHVQSRQRRYSTHGLRNNNSRQLVGSRLMERFAPFRRVRPDNENIDVRFVAAKPRRARCRLLAGMIRANRPWTILPAFKGIIAVAFATGAYGLVFPSLWRLSDAYEPWRFVLLMLTSISAMVAWIIIDHRLWEPRHAANSTTLRRLYNLATIGTLTMGVLCYYATLFALFLLAVALFVPGDLLGKTLGHEATAGSFPALAWLASSVATVAGALGSSLESDETVRNATYGFRQQKRQEQIQSGERASKQD